MVFQIVTGVFDIEVVLTRYCKLRRVAGREDWPFRLWSSEIDKNAKMVCIASLHVLNSQGYAKDLNVSGVVI